MSALSAPAAGGDIIGTAVAAGSFKTLVAAVKAAGLVDALKAPGPLTVLAPSDEAFAKLPAGTVESLLKPENKKQLVNILTYHVIPSKAKANDVRKLDAAKALNGQQIAITFGDDGLQIDGAKLVKTDIECSNGVIHVIDAVILPEDDNIPAVASKAGDFETLLAAAQAAEMVEALSGDGPLTVFAPTDEAFSKLPAGTVDALLLPENKQQLANILKYHVVAGRVYAADAIAAKHASTLLGEKVSISTHSGAAKVNDARLLKTDINASNGVIHVIDTVLLPPSNQTKSSTQHRKHSLRPRQMIQNAIAEGAPIYNAGHHGDCARLYMRTAEELLARKDHGLNQHQVNALQNALHRARHSRSMDARAWTMRTALDNAYVNLLNQR